jgi:hypothetical protein
MSTIVGWRAEALEECALVGGFGYRRQVEFGRMAA